MLHACPVDDDKSLGMSMKPFWRRSRKSDDMNAYDISCVRALEKYLDVVVTDLSDINTIKQHFQKHAQKDYLEKASSSVSSLGTPECSENLMMLQHSHTKSMSLTELDNERIEAHVMSRAGTRQQRPS